MFLDKSRVGLIQPYEESGAIVGVKLIRPGAKLCLFTQPCQFVIRDIKIKIWQVQVPGFSLERRAKELFPQ